MGASATVTVLFCDLVGSTALLTSLSAEAGDELRRRCFDALRGAVRAHGGDEVKNLGDGLMVVFSSAAQAVGCGAAMQRALGTLRREGGPAERVALRVGISAGEATQDDGDWFGTPVIEAARLCAAAETGQVLLSEIVRLLCGSHGGHVFTAAAAYELKGLPAPVMACAVEWDLVEDGSAAGLPAALRVRAGAPFVGRAAELERLRLMWKLAGDEQRVRTALLAGEPGAGKTRLAAQIATEVVESGGRVLFGRSDEELGVPYQPFVEALDAFWDATPDRALLGRYPEELVRILPRLAGEAEVAPPAASDPDTEQYRLFQAITSWLTTASADRPVLLVLDDLHWAGKPTLLLLRHLVRVGQEARLLVVGTYRDTDLDRVHPLSSVLADLRREETVERLAVAGLDSGEVAAFVEAATGHRLDAVAQRLADAVHTETAGNPFFVGEVVRHLTETGVLWLDGDHWTSDRSVEQAGIPEGVREVVGRRVSRLTQGADEVLRAAAVVGQRFEFDVLCRVTGEVALAEQVIEEAVRAQLVQEREGARLSFAFTHALVRATLYEELSALRRARLHRAVADIVEEQLQGRAVDRAAELAHHWLQAGAGGEPERALRWVTLAGEQALQALAWEQAAHWFEQAAELMADGDFDDATQARVLLGLGLARRGAGDPQARRTLVQAAQRAQAAGDGELSAQALLAGSRALTVPGRVDWDVVRLIEEVLSARADEVSATSMRLQALLAVEIQFDPSQVDRRALLTEQSLAMARRLGDPLLLEEALSLYIASLPAADNLDSLVAAGEELGALAPSLTDPRRRVMNAVMRWLVLMASGGIDEAGAVLAEAVRSADEFGERSLRWHLSHLQVTELSLRGHAAEIRPVLEQALELGRGTDQPDLDDWMEAQSIPLTIDASGFDHLVPALPPGGRDYHYNPVHRLMVATVLARAGDAAGARGIVEDTLAQGLVKDGGLLFSLRVLSEAVVRLGAVDLAPEVIERARVYTGRLCFAPVVVMGSMDDVLGRMEHLLGRLDEAAGHFEASIRLCEQIGTRRWAAHARRHLATVLLDRQAGDDTARAAELLRVAETDAEALGLDRLVGRVRRTAARLEPAGP